MKYIRILLVTLLPVITMQITAQEICNNGLDDDLDNLIDIYDPDCCNDNNYLSYLFCIDSCGEEINIEEDLQLTVVAEQLQPDYWSAINVPLVYTKMIDGEARSYMIGRNGVEVIRNHSSLSILSLSDDAKTIDIEKIHRWGVPYGVINIGTEENPEIIIVIATSDDADEIRKLIAYREDGSLLWISSEQYTPLDSYDAAVIGFADFNEDGIPEVYCGPSIFDMRNGEKIAGLTDYSLSKGVQQRANYDMSMIVSAIDIIPDDSCATCTGLELLSGNTIYTVDIGDNTITPYQIIPETTDGYSIAISPDGNIYPHVFLVHNDEDGTYITLWNPEKSQIVFQNKIFDEPQYSSIPIFYKSDITPGQSYLILNSENTILCYQYDNGSITELWDYTTVDFSGQTGISLYKYATNREPVIMHRGQERFRLLDVTDGHVMWETACRSSTNIEMPIAISLDDEDQASILCSCGGNLMQFRPEVKTLPAQKHWNQYLFDNVNINPDLTIPQQRQKKSFLGPNYNSFMFPISSDKLPLPDIRIDEAYINCNSENMTMYVNFSKTNLASWPDPLVCYVIDPVSLDTIIRDSFLGLNSLNLSGSVQLDLGSNYLDEYLLLVNSTSINSTGIISSQCSSRTLFEDVYYYLSSYDILPDTLALCNIDIIDFSAPEEELEYVWNDGLMGLDRSFLEDGLFILSYSDQCGVTLRDSVFIMFENQNQIDITDLRFCSNPYKSNNNDTLCFQVNSGIVITNSSVSFNQIDNEVCVIISDETEIVLFSENLARCTDTTTIEIDQQIMPSLERDIRGCYGSVIQVEGVSIDQDTSIQFRYPHEGCDSIVLINVEFDEKPIIRDSLILLCEGGEIKIEGQKFRKDTLFTLTEYDANGCPISVNYEIALSDTSIQQEMSETLCLGDTIRLGDLVYTSSIRDTIFSQTMGGCDSLTILDFHFMDSIPYQLDYGNACNNMLENVHINAEVDGVELMWNDGSTESNRALPAGRYTITLSAEGYCKTNIDVNIKKIDIVFPEITLISESCPETDDGVIDVTNAKDNISIYQNSILIGNGSYYMASGGDEYRIVYTQDKCEVDTLIVFPTVENVEILYPTQVQIDEFDTIIVEPVLIDADSIVEIYWEGEGILCDTCIEFSYVGKSDEYLRGTFITNTNCIFKRNIEVIVNKGNLLYIPNSFSPNMDGRNDIFKVYPGTRFAYIKSIEIYNRWGKRVFKKGELSGNSGQGITILDGSFDASNFVLAYKIIVVDKYNSEYLLNGTITVLK